MDILSQFFAGLGLNLMVGLAGCGSATGLFITGAAVVGAIKKKPESFGLVLVLAAMPASQGLYGFVSSLLYSGKVTESISLFHSCIILGVGVSVGLVNLISAIMQGKVCATGINAVGSGHNAFGQTLILGAFVEFYAILSLVSGIIMMNFLQ